MRRRGEDIPRAGAVKQPKYDSIEYLICSSDEENLQEVQTEDEPIIYNFVDVNNYADPNIQILTETATLQKPISKTVIPKQLTKTGPNTANIPKTSVNSNKTPQTPLSASLNKISVNTAASNSKMPPLVLRTPISNLVQSGFAKVTQNVTTTPTYRFTLANNSKSQEAIKNLSSKATGNKDNTPTYCAITEKLSQIESTLDAFIVNVNRRFHYLNILMNKIVQQNDRILSNHLTSTSIKENIELSEDEKLVEKITVKAVTKLQGNFTEVACIYEVGVDIPQELEELNMELIDTERQIHYRSFLRRQVSDITCLIQNFWRIATDSCLSAYNGIGDEGKLSLQELTNWLKCFEDTYHISQIDVLDIIAAAAKVATIRVHRRKLHKKPEIELDELDYS